MSAYDTAYSEAFGGDDVPLPAGNVLSELRTDVGKLLADVSPDVAVHDGPVDSVTPPAYILVWAGPRKWLAPISQCAFTSCLQVVCVAARIDPTPGYEQLEELVLGALNALHSGGIPHEGAEQPLPQEFGGVTYLSARINLTKPINTR